MITREFNLYLHAGHSIPLVINVNQYDRGESWVFTLFNSDGTQYTPSSGAIVGIKSDNLGIINSGTVDSQGRVVINETQQMTAAVGKAVFELLIDDQTHGTANFIVLVEPKPGDNADLSESDYSLFQQAIDGTSATAIAEGVADWMDENLTPTTPVVDASLTVQGAAADAKKTGDEISALKSQITNGVPYEVKQALDTILQNVAFKNDTDYSSAKSAIHNWATSVNLVSISAVYTQSGTVYDIDSLDGLKEDLVVTASYDNGTSETVSDYTLSGELTVGTSVITVAYGGKTTSFSVTVTEATREVRFGTFTKGYALAKKLQSNQGGTLPTRSIWNNSTASRAAMTVPVVNRGYVITTTDSSKYTVAVYDVSDNTPNETTYSAAVTGVYYAGGTKSPAWVNSDSATTPYIMIALKKSSGEFTDAELANGAEAVFTFTEGS